MAHLIHFCILDSDFPALKKGLLFIMKQNTKNIIIILSFIVIIYGFMLANILMPDMEVSYSERRYLAKAPNYSTKTLLSGEVFEKYEKYILDQFVLRDDLRVLKAFTRFRIFNQKDNNGIYLIDKGIYKIEYPLNEKAIINAASKFNEVYQKYLHGMNVSYAIIPDRNYFVASKNGYISMDYDRLIELMKYHVTSINYINLFDALDLNDYYKTDIHWSQSEITDIASMILKEMRKGDIDSIDTFASSYDEKSLYPFYGSYYGQAAFKLMPDTLVYLTNKMIEEAVVYDHIDKTYSKVYMEDKFGAIDSYDFFLSGGKSLLTIDNTKSTSDKELILFRDSFGSSIAPLLLEGYAKITLVDLRYIRTDMLGDYIDFTKDQDVLFLYNTLILNNSYMLK